MSSYTRINPDPKNFLGLEYNRYLTKLRTCALQKPSAVTQYRDKIYDDLDDAISIMVYGIISDALYNGTIGGKNIWEGIPGLELPNPRVPDQEISQLAMGITKGLKEKLTNVSLMLIPENVLKTIGEKYAEQGQDSLRIKE